MGQKLNRQKLIAELFFEFKSSKSATEIWQFLYGNCALELSRKSIDRDLKELVQSGVLIRSTTVPTKYRVNPNSSISLEFTQVELKILISYLEKCTAGPNSEEVNALKLKLKNKSL